MKCTVLRCTKSVGSPLLARSRGPRPPALELCPGHQRGYNKAFDVHFKPFLAPGARQRLARAFGTVHADATIAEAMSAGRLRSWQSHWLQQVDLELLYHTEPAPEPSPSAPEVKAVPREPLPLAATKNGQAILAKRAAEEALLEQRLKAEVKEYAKGQRQVLELELKTKRAAEEAEARKKKAKA